MGAPIEIAELTGHAKKACAEKAGGAQGLRYAEFCRAQAIVCRAVALALEEEAIAHTPKPESTKSLDEAIARAGERRAAAPRFPQPDPNVVPWHLRSERKD